MCSTHAKCDVWNWPYLERLIKYVLPMYQGRSRGREYFLLLLTFYLYCLMNELWLFCCLKFESVYCVRLLGMAFSEFSPLYLFHNNYTYTIATYRFVLFNSINLTPSYFMLDFGLILTFFQLLDFPIFRKTATFLLPILLAYCSTVVFSSYTHIHIYTHIYIYMYISLSYHQVFICIFVLIRITVLRVILKWMNIDILFSTWQIYLQIFIYPICVYNNSRRMGDLTLCARGFNALHKFYTGKLRSLWFNEAILWWNRANHNWHLIVNSAFQYRNLY